MNEGEEMDEKIEEVDGRTTIGKMQARLKDLEDNQKKIQETLDKHGKAIAECSVRR